jgi:transposase
MATPRRKKYRPWHPAAYAQQAFSPAGRLPDGDLVFFLLDLVPQLDLDPFYASYEVETRGQPPYDPGLLVCLWLYAYAVGVYSSRKLATACERNLAFLAIVGDDRPDFRTVSDFRKLHLDAFADTFTQVLRVAKEAGLVQLGVLATDGTKVAGNASRHKAMSYGYLTKEVQRLRAEIDALLQQAQEHDVAEDAVLGSRRGDELPEELKRREDRLATLQAARQRLEEQARLEAEAERQRRAEAEAERHRTGKKRRGKEPKPVSDTPADRAQTNFTDPELKIMPTNNKGWDYCGNAQTVVEGACQIIVACDVVVASNDKEQAVPLAQAALINLEQAGIARPTRERPLPNLLDSGYYSEKATQGLEALGLDPYLATERQRHHGSALPTATAPATAKEKMAAKLRTEAGRALYALRKTIVEPVFGQIKGARGFRRFLLRGLEKIRGEWRLVCLTHNLLKVWRYGCAPSGN